MPNTSLGSQLPAIANRTTTLRRLTFFNVDANTVRQLAELSVDGSKTWTVIYDLKYLRKGKHI